VRECAVVPCATLGGTEPVAVVLLSGDESQLPQAVQNANQELATFQQIRRVLIWPEPQFPYTSTGKLLRRKVTAWVCRNVMDQSGAHSNSHGPGSQGKGTDLLLDFIAEVTGERASGNDDTLRLTEDLHLDSLGRVQLQSSLEQQLEIELQDDALANIQTLGELRALLTAHAPHLASPSQSPAANLPASHASASPPQSRSLSSPEPGREAGAAELPATRLATAALQEPESRPAPAPTAIPESQKPRATGAASDDLKALTADFMYPRWPWNWLFASIRVAFLEIVMRPLVWLLGKPRVTLPASGIPDGPLLIIANHVTAYDGALVLYALPFKLRKRVAIAMLGEMLLDYRRGRNQGNFLLNLFAPPQYWMVTAFFNVFPMPRANGFRKSFQHAGEAMDRGYSVMVFPEGARHFEGGIRPFRPGIGLLTQESEVPVLPVALIGLEEIHRRGMLRSRLFGPDLLEIRIGEAIPVDRDADPAAVTSILEYAVRKLCQ
jgi:long-chain acyl-CoA synthetase